MNLDSIREIIRRKPAFFFYSSVIYLIITALMKWMLEPTIGTLMYVLGGLVGIYFLDIAEVFFKLNPSPFRTMIFVVSFVVVSVFIITSSTTMEARGLVLSIYLTLVLWQTGQWQMSGNLNSWYANFRGGVDTRIQFWILAVFVGIFIFETVAFVL